MLLRSLGFVKTLKDYKTKSDLSKMIHFFFLEDCCGNNHLVRGWTVRMQLIIPLREVMRPLIKAMPIKIEERTFHKMTI